MVIRQRHNPRTQLPERGGRESDLGVTVRSVDRQVAVDDHRIAFRRVGKLARHAPILPEESVRRRKVDVGQDDDAGHALLPYVGKLEHRGDSNVNAARLRSDQGA